MHFYKDDYQFISIHALREEGDCKMAAASSWANNFYPRPPRGGRRKRDKPCVIMIRFLSTPSARRATFAAGIAIA